MPAPLRVALLTYRGNAHCGGQGVYSRELARALGALGHSVTVLSGPPYPDLGDPSALVKVPSLDLYRPENPFRMPWLHELRTSIDARELAIMLSGGFPEPLTFSLRARRLLQSRRADFDLVHDNQGLGWGLLPMMRHDGWPLIATVHHPIAVDRELEVAHAPTRGRKFALRRWYRFTRMQDQVARSIPRLITVSEASRAEIARRMGVPAERIHVVPVGVDTTVFAPRPAVPRTPGRIMTTASADVAVKGLSVLVEALAKVRTERPDAHLVVIGAPRPGSPIPGLVSRLGLDGAVEYAGGITTDQIVARYASAEVACVPSRYEGFSLPAIEAMACGVPVVATTAGAVPEVVGTHDVTGLLVPAGDPSALAAALLRALGDPDLRARLGAAGRARVHARFTWSGTAQQTAACYEALLDDLPPRDRAAAC